jgi:peptidase M28-like protein
MTMMRRSTRRMTRVRSLGLAGMLALNVAGASGQQAPPAPQRQPLLDPKGFVREDAYLPAPLPDSEKAYAAINGAHMKSIVNEIVAISRKSRDDGNKYWGRIAGTKYEAMTADLLEARFRKLGMVDINRPEFPLGPQWFPTDWDITASGGGQTLSFASARPALGSAATRAAGLDVDAVWVGLGTAADFSGRDVRGKAAVIHSMLSPGQMGQSATFEGAFKRASEAGAAAIVAIWGYYDNMAAWQGFNGGFNSPGFPPGFFVGFDDGKKLRNLIGAGPVKLKLKIQTEMRPNLKSISIYGTLPGTTDESIIVMAHMDGWFDAALDNASGLATMVALAEHFAQIPKEKRRRSITFIGTAGHHVGSPNAIYLRDKRADLLARTALMINCEHVSVSQTLNWDTTLRRSTAVWPRRWNVNGSAKLTDLVLDAYKTFGVGVVGDMDPTATGEMGAIFRLAPSLQLIRSPESKHTDADVPEYVPAVGLEAVGRAYAKIIDEANKLDLRALKPETPVKSSAGRQ